MALLFFAEAENVGHVGGAGAVEEPLVFAEDGLAEWLSGGAGAPRAGGTGGVLGAEEKILEGEGGAAVAGGVEMDAVVGERGTARGGWSECVEERKERQMARGGDFAKRGGEAREGRVVRGGGGVGRTES